MFLRHNFTQSRIASTSAWKAVASCPCEMCHCSLLWYLQIPAPVSCWLQAPSVSQTCLFFLSSFGQFSPPFPSRYHYPIFTKSALQDLWRNCRKFWEDTRGIWKNFLNFENSWRNVWTIIFKKFGKILKKCEYQTSFEKTRKQFF